MSLDDVDLGLGGLNQDLPAPSVDCLDMDVSIGCFAVSGEYNGEPFEIVCDDDRHILNGLGGVNGHYIEGCYNTEVNGERFDVEVLLAASLIIRPPSTFSADAASADAFFNLFRPDRELHPYVNRGFTMYQLGESHDLAFRLAGISHLFERPLLPGSTQPEYEWHVEGAFALSLTPKSGCVPNAMGFGCDDIRLRGHFNATPAKDPPGTP